MPEIDLMPTSAAARALGVDTRTVIRWAKSGRLPVALRGEGIRGAMWFDPADVERVRQERTAELEAQLAAISSPATEKVS